jgi:hypothetical protein
MRKEAVGREKLLLDLRMTMDILVEILLEVYMELMFLIVPEKDRGKRHVWIARGLAILMLAVVVSLCLYGVWLLVDKDNSLGVLPIAVAAFLSLAQIVAGIILYNKNH